MSFDKFSKNNNENYQSQNYLLSDIITSNYVNNNQSNFEFVQNQIKQSDLSKQGTLNNDDDQFKQGYLDELNDCTQRIITQRIGEQNKINKNDKIEQQKINESDNEQFVIYGNKQSIVDIRFDTTLNNFIITKQNLSEEELYDKEQTILEKLNGSNITLQIVSKNQQNYQFQQIAGKITMQNAKYIICSQLIQKYYFILIEKLNKMHEIGIAHSDIKPSNIVLSFDLDPFFIDFGGSIILSDQNDWKNYLNFFTFKYNLEIYFSEINLKEEKYRPKQFKSKEDIKLCDRVQLSLTFLFLVCDNQTQKKLFQTKKYNELLENMMKGLNEEDKHKKETIIFLFHISTVLNQADPKINIVQDGKQLIFEIDDSETITQLENLLDISQNQSSNIFYVYRIDKFNIWFIYFLDKQGYRLKITPKATLIPIGYLLKITAKSDESKRELEIWNFIKDKYKINENFFKPLKNKSIDLRNDIQILYMQQQILDFQIKNICISCYYLSNLQILKKFLCMLFELKLSYTFKLKIEFDQAHQYEIIDYLKVKNSNYCVENIQINKSKKIIKLRIGINQEILISDFSINILIYLDLFDDLPIEELKFIINHFKIKQLQFFNLDRFQRNNKNEQQDQLYKIIYLINKFSSMFDQEISHDENITIIIRIYNQRFNSFYFWIQIEDFLTKNRNFNIEILIFNCFFSYEDVQYLKTKHQQDNNQLIYEFHDNNIEQQGIQNIELRIEQSLQKQNQQRQKKNIMKNKEVRRNFSNQALHIIEMQMQDYYKRKEISQQNQQIDYRLISNSFREIFRQNTQIPDLKSKLKIKYGEEIYIQNFRFKNKNKYIKTKNEINLLQNINSIIQNIQQRNHYRKIKFEGKSYQLLDSSGLKIKCVYQQNLQNNFDEITLALSNHYNCKNFLNKNHCINYEIGYNFFSIRQTVENQQFQYNYSDIFTFFRSNANQIYNNNQQINSHKLLILKYFIGIYDNLTDLESNILKDNLIDSINHFQKNSLINILLRNELNSKPLLFVFEIQSDKKPQFKILFDYVQNLFPINKVYKFTREYNYEKDNRQINQDVIDEIYECLKSDQCQQKVFFDLSELGYLYNKVRQFIIKCNELKNKNEIMFRIQNENQPDLEKQLKKDLENIMKIESINESYFILKYKQKSKQKATETETIQIEFKINNDQDQNKKLSKKEKKQIKNNNKKQDKLIFQECLIE